MKTSEHAVQARKYNEDTEVQKGFKMKSSFCLPKMF